MRTLRALGIRSVAVLQRCRCGRPPRPRCRRRRAHRPGTGALKLPPLDRVIEAALAVGAPRRSIPGYGFLSENPALAAPAPRTASCSSARPRGDRGDGRQDRRQGHVARPACPSSPAGRRAGDDDAVAEAELGFPVLLKPSAGGGGKGMRPSSPARCRPSRVGAARGAARSATTRCSSSASSRKPRHIEIQVLADAHGNVVHLGERECSLQRRHQKIVEEAPSPLLDAEVRAAMGAQAVAAARPAGTPAPARSSSSSRATDPTSSSSWR